MATKKKKKNRHLNKEWDIHTGFKKYEENSYGLNDLAFVICFVLTTSQSVSSESRPIRLKMTKQAKEGMVKNILLE